MALIDDKPRILAALAAVWGVKKALPAWPKTWAELPCVVVTEAGNKPVDYRDDKIHVVELEYYVRVFTETAQERSTIASAVDDAMGALGYRRSFSWEEDGEGGRQKALRYKKLF